LQNIPRAILPDPRSVKSNVLSFTVGTYTLTYRASDPSDNAADAVTRTVTVVDKAKPVISLTGANPMTVECHSVFTDPGATANDTCAGSFAATPSGTVDPNTVGTYTLTYTASDPSGNAAVPVTRTVNVVDTTAPVITLNGASPMTVECRSSFTDPGAAAEDPGAGSLAVSVTGSVNADTPGIYTLTYRASDLSGNAAVPVIRTVNVLDTTAPFIACPGNKEVNADPLVCSAVVNGIGPTGAGDNGPGYKVTHTLTDVTTGSGLNDASGRTFNRGVTTVTYTITDGAGLTAWCSFTVTVLNPSPAVTLTGPASGSLYAIKTPVNFTASFTDAGGGTHSGTWTFDALSQAATIVEPSANAAGTAKATYTFTTPGVYTVKLTLNDSCGGSSTGEQIGGVDVLVVVYDPSGGFVTGGGWIDSPPGAYVPDPTLVGKANFGFNSKY
jgi:hypothetical protein